MYRVWSLLREYSLLLGSVIALAWANTNPESYHHFLESPLLVNDLVGYLHEGRRVLTVHYLVDDLGMALFFAVAGKTVWEAFWLRNGSLHGHRALTPLTATAGGMIAPAGLYLIGAAMLGKFTILAHGWAIPTATDIAFSYLVGRMVFGANHPAIKFLLLVAIADDAAGLMIITIFYPQSELHLEWLLLSAVAAVTVYVLCNWLPRRLDRGNQARPNSTFVNKHLAGWPYAIAGCLSWLAFQNAGLHPVLGLLPIIPAVPHADFRFGIHTEMDSRLNRDLLTRMERGLKVPIELVLFMFGLVSVGVELSTMSDVTWLVVLALLIGKPLGIWLFGELGARVLNFGMPEGVNGRELLVVGVAAGICFTVSLFVASVAFPPGMIQDAAKMGAVLSFGMAPTAIILGRLLRIRRQDGTDEAPTRG